MIPRGASSRGRLSSTSRLRLRDADILDACARGWGFARWLVGRCAPARRRRRRVTLATCALLRQECSEAVRYVCPRTRVQHTSSTASETSVPAPRVRLYRLRAYGTVTGHPAPRRPRKPRNERCAPRWSVERRPGPPLSFASALKSYPPGHLEHLDCVTGSPLRTHMASHHTTCRAPLPLSDTSHLTLHKCVSSSPSRACPPHVAS